ncbi:aspartate/glutamate racemase family protein [Amorphus sp. 3PC139-8]|uniref:aspartate/glutamate racemase family protein n=1 Tax=Amorphus sp. 3PC139-8 TaxID=2735676 RepID=UPI00345D14AE
MTSDGRTARRIGLVGGMSWHSSALYYARLNEAAEARFGPHANVESILVTLRFADLLAAADNDDWATVSDMIATAAQRAERAGATCILLTAFTAHFAAEDVAARLGVSLLNAGDALAAECRRRGLRRIGLLGTAATLGSGAIAERLAACGIATVLPDGGEAAALDDCIRRDLTRGDLSPAAGEAFDRAVDALRRKGAEAAALACTELPLLLPRQSPIPLIDGVSVHVRYALDT